MQTRSDEDLFLPAYLKMSKCLKLLPKMWSFGSPIVTQACSQLISKDGNLCFLFIFSCRLCVSLVTSLPTWFGGLKWKSGIFWHMKHLERIRNASARGAEAVSPQGGRMSATFQLKLRLKFPQVPAEGWNIFRREWAGFECNYSLHRQVKREGWRWEASTGNQARTHTRVRAQSHALIRDWLPRLIRAVAMVTRQRFLLCLYKLCCKKKNKKKKEKQENTKKEKKRVCTRFCDDDARAQSGGWAGWQPGAVWLDGWNNNSNYDNYDILGSWNPSSGCCSRMSSQKN